MFCRRILPAQEVLQRKNTSMRHSRNYRQEDAATISLNPIHLEQQWRSKLAEGIYDVSVGSCFQSFATVSVKFNIIS
jgi:hypothetical protein